MNIVKVAKQTKYSVEELNDIIIDAIQDLKGKQIVKLDLRAIHDRPTDFFIICQGESNVKVKSISDSIKKRVKEDLGTFPAHMEGTVGAKWVLVDYFETVVHVFYPEMRDFYDIEGLWSDAVITTYKDID